MHLYLDRATGDPVVLLRGAHAPRVVQPRYTADRDTNTMRHCPATRTLPSETATWYSPETLPSETLCKV